MYYVFIVYGRRRKVESGSRMTSYAWLLGSKKSFVSRFIEKLGLGRANDNMNQYKILVYFLLQFGYTVISILPVSLCYYRYM